jgi:hypothetical protein
MRTSDGRIGACLHRDVILVKVKPVYSTQTLPHVLHAVAEAGGLQLLGVAPAGPALENGTCVTLQLGLHRAHARSEHAQFRLHTSERVGRNSEICCSGQHTQSVCRPVTVLGVSGHSAVPAQFEKISADLKSSETHTIQSLRI